MSVARDDEHEQDYYAQLRRRHEQASLLVNEPDSPSSRTHAPLQTHPGPPRLLSISTDFQRPAHLAHQGRIVVEPHPDELSPDPYEFYRPSQPSLVRQTSAFSEPAHGFGEGEEGENMTVQSRKSNLPTSTVNGTTSKQLHSTGGATAGGSGGRTSARASTMPRQSSSSSAASRSNVSLAGSTRARQPSLKDLVNRFNQANDETLPVPSASQRPESKTPALAVRSKASASSTARISSRSDPVHGGRKELGRDQAKGPVVIPPRRSGRNGVTSKAANDATRSDGGASSAKSPKPERSKVPAANNPWASQSMMTMHLSQTEPARRPLFGEVVGVVSGSADAGFGISSRQRRGSEGGLRPSLAQRGRSKSDYQVSPSSPTAWYLGAIPSLEGVRVNDDSPPVARPPHRRAKSDFARNPTSVEPHADNDRRKVPTLARPVESKSKRSTNQAAKSVGQSRIPLSNRRRSAQSDAGSTMSESRTSSSLASPVDAQPYHARGHSSALKTNNHSGRPAMVRPITPQRTSSRRYERSTGSYTGSSPTLKAYISAPAPPKSPTLRRTRPRLPVSTATTSASRAKAAERAVQPQVQPTGKPRRHAQEVQSGPKKIPELGSVDFAARRERIQRAFTRTVRERELEEERAAEELRDRSKLKRPEVVSTNSVPEVMADDIEPGETRVDEDKPVDHGHETRDAGELDSIAEQLVRDSELHVPLMSASQPAGQHVHVSLNPGTPDFQDEGEDLDSPTLGIPGAFPRRFSAHGLNATTADTSPASVPEEQLEQPAPYLEPVPDGGLTAAADVESVRSTPLLSSRTFNRQEWLSERDDRELIQIALESGPLAGDVKQTGDKSLGRESAEDEPRRSIPGSESRVDLSHHSPHLEQAEERLAIEASGGDDHQSDPRNAHLDYTDAPLTGHSVESLQTPDPMRSTLDSTTYTAINRVLEQYHGSDFSNPEYFRDFRQQLLAMSPEIARLSNMDSTRMTELFIQELDRATIPTEASTAETPRVESEVEQAAHVPEEAHRDAEASGTEIDSSSSEIEASEQIRGYQLSEGGWPSTRPSFEVVDDSRPLSTASLRCREDWEKASPLISEWVQPQARDGGTHEADADHRPTPPPKDWTVPVERRNFSDSAQTDLSPSTREDAATPRLSVGSRPQLPELKSTGEGLGLAINVGDLRPSPVFQAPPLPTHSPPPPPVCARIEEDAPRPERRWKAGRRAPSPHGYSRNQPSSVFTPTSPEDVQAETKSTIPSETSSQPHYVFTPSAVQAQSSSSSQSYEPHSRERPSGQPTDMPGRSSSPDPEQRRLTRRRLIIKELLDTEASFYQDMTVAVEIYKGSLKDADWINPDDVKTLFGNADQIVAFTTNFFYALRQAASSVHLASKLALNIQNKRTSASTANSTGTEDRLLTTGTDLSEDEKDRRTFIGEAFGQHLAQMEKVYGDYLKNHDAANKRLAALQTQPKVAIWLQQCKLVAEDLTSAWSLDSLLVKPVQRFLKYPLLLAEILERTPENHPDFTALDFAAREMKGASRRVNEMKRRVDLVEKAVARKHKDSDVRAGLSKAFGRRTEKLKQQVGLSEIVDDPTFNQIANKWHSNYIQLQFVMRDVADYVTKVQKHVDSFQRFVQAIELFIDVGQTTHPELESRWRKFGIAMRELSGVALSEHRAAVETGVLEPMRTLIRMYDGPQKVLQKRNKRVTDFARYKAANERGDKLDKRTVEQGEQFLALNDTLKEELPKLYALTGKLAEACLSNFFKLQRLWQKTWQVKLKSVLDEHQARESLKEIVNQFSGDFTFTDTQVLGLGICNGSILADAMNFLSPISTHTGESTSSKRPSVTSGRHRAVSLNSEASPHLPQPDFGRLHNGGFTLSPFGDSTFSYRRDFQNGMQPLTMDRIRAGSTVSNPGAKSPDFSTASRSFSVFTAPSPSGVIRPRTSTGPSMESTYLTRPSLESPGVMRPPSTSTYYTSAQDLQSPGSRPYSGFYSSAMPMSDSEQLSPRASRPPTPPAEQSKWNMLFCAASLFEFNINRGLTEGGYPYLTYVPGEVFDVFAEKGELWLARNQDDNSHQIGWIWCRHFKKLTDA